MEQVVIDINKAYVPSEDVVARIIEGELILVPLVAGPPETEGELYSLNETGKVIWDLLAPELTVQQLAEKLGGEYGTPVDLIREDIAGLLSELMIRHIVRPA